MVDEAILMTIKDYFEERAGAYDEKRSSGFLGWLRKNEREAVLSLLDVQKGETVLDAGCGEGHYAWLAKTKGAKSCGIDRAESMIAKLKEKGIEGTVCDIENFSLGKKFDKIICAGVLEFIENPGSAIRMLAKHLKPKGSIIFLYSRPSLGTFAYVLLHRLHSLSLKVISQKKLQKLLNEAGLEITAHKKLPFFGGVARAEHKKKQ